MIKPISMVETSIQGCFVFQGQSIEDERGSFSKVFNHEFYEKAGLSTPINEVFYSKSNRGVIRGMHFQSPPFDLVKIVSCLSGRILDVVLDLRINSSTYGQFFSAELTPENAKTMIVPSGCAHGFYAFEDNSIVGYLCSKGFNSKADHGILWSSFGFVWPEPETGAIDYSISSRDSQLPSYKEFQSPFV